MFHSLPAPTPLSAGMKTEVSFQQEQGMVSLVQTADDTNSSVLDMFCPLSVLKRTRGNVGPYSTVFNPNTQKIEVKTQKRDGGFCVRHRISYHDLLSACDQLHDRVKDTQRALDTAIHVKHEILKNTSQ